jgi:DNA-binding transcriptional MocR family regulator
VEFSRIGEPVRLDTDPYLDRYAERVQGLKTSEIRALFSVAARPEVVSFAGGMPATSHLDLKAVEQVAAKLIRDHGATALQYGGGQGRVELREQLVQVMAEEQVPGHADDIVVTIGGQQALELVAKCFLNKGDLVLAEGPTYVGGIGAINSHQGDIQHIPMDGDGMRTDVLADELERLKKAGRRVKYVYTIPNHQNPAGVSLSLERRHHLAALAEQYDLMIVEDNPYGLLDFNDTRRVSLKSLLPERVIYVCTLSKLFAPGVRTGWIAAPAPIRDKLVLLREAADLCPPNLTQMLMEAWFGTQPWQAQVRRFTNLYEERAKVMLASLEKYMPDGVTWTVPTGAFYIWLTVPGGIDTSALLPKAVQRRVAYVPGRGFFADGSGENHLRLSFSFPETDRIAEGVSRLGELLHDERELREAVYGRTPPPPESS